MYCSRCGAANPDGLDVRYCRACGAELAGAADPTAGTPGALGVVSPTAAPGYPLGGAPGALPGVSLAATAARAAPFPYGGFWIRLVAYLIDIVILSAVAVAVGVLIGIIVAVGAAARRGGLGPTDLGSELGGLAGLVLQVAYQVVLPPMFGATPGKLVLGYHVVDESGRHVGYGQALGRWLGQIISGLVLGLGYVWIGVDSHKQGWHDKIAGTYVVRKEFVGP